MMSDNDNDNDNDEFDFSEWPIEESFAKPLGLSPPDADAVQPEPSFEAFGPSCRRSRRRVFAATLVAVAFVAAGMTAGFWLGSERNGSDDVADLASEVGSDPTSAAATTEPDDSAERFTNTSPDFDSSAPDGPAPSAAPHFPTLGLFDSFSRADSDELGITESGQKWAEVAGAWSIESRSAAVSEPNSAGPSIAVANTRATRGVVQATMASVERGAGLVFRYTNPFNYWAMTAAPESGTWSISQVSKGESTAVGSLGPTRVDDNTTIAIRFDEYSMDFVVDGTKVTSIIAPDLLGGTYAGLIARGPGTVDARWANFVALALSEPDS